jgi:spore coat protein U-like protein
MKSRYEVMKLRACTKGYIYIVCLLFALVCSPQMAYAACNKVAPLDGTPFNATVGVFFTQTWSGNGNCAPWTSSYPAGYLGLTFTNDTLAGIPTGTVINYPFTVTENNGVIYHHTLTITAVGCSFVGGSSGAIYFSNIDPTAAVSVIGSVTTPVQFTCPVGTAYTIAMNPASGWQLTSGPNTIGYTPGVVPSGTYAGTAVDVFTAGGSNITQSQYVNVPAGTYSNASAVTVTISWTGGSITASLPIGSVTGIVQDICSVSGSPALNFGTLDAITNASGAVATVTPPSLMCTMGSSVTVTSNGGLNFSGTPRLKDASTNYINYSFGFTSPLSGAGGSTDIGGSGAGHLSMGATIPAGGLDNVPAGTYTDTITLTISY